MPIWGDVASLGFNFLYRGYRQLLTSLAVVQASPILFLWSELTVIRIAGTSELAFAICSDRRRIAALLLFWPVARLAFKPLPRRARTRTARDRYLRRFVLSRPSRMGGQALLMRLARGGMPSAARISEAF